MKKTLFFLFTIITLITVNSFAQESAGEKRTSLYQGRKVLYIDSYQNERKGSLVKRQAARDILEAAGVEMRVVYMDAKRKRSEEQLRKAALAVKGVIESWEPHLILASDDAASKYLIAPYFKDADIPFVFFGVNWDASQYGFPCSNVTGQIEVEQVKDLTTELKKYARGERVGLLTSDTLTDRKTVDYYTDILGISFTKTAFVRDFESWKRAYEDLQKEVDILLVRSVAGIEGWNAKEAVKIVNGRTIIPTGTISSNTRRYVLVSFTKVNREFGEYGARTALEILGGRLPSDIPVTTNTQAKVYLNMSLAKNLELKFPMKLIERATFVDQQE